MEDYISLKINKNQQRKSFLIDFAIVNQTERGATGIMHPGPIRGNPPPPYRPHKDSEIQPVTFSGG